MSLPEALLEECHACLIFSKNPDAQHGEQGGEAPSAQVLVSAAWEQGHGGAGFAGSGFSVTKSVEWLCTSVFRQRLQFSFYSFVRWAIVPVCPWLRRFLRCRISSTKSREVTGKLGKWSPSLPAPLPVSSLISSHCHAVQDTSQTTLFAVSGAFTHGGAWGAWQNKQSVFKDKGAP